MFDRTTTKQARETLQREFDALTQRMGNGWTLKLGDATINGNTVNFKLELVDTSGGAAPGQDEFNLYCSEYGLETTDFGREFTSGGRTFKLCGIKPRATKMPLLAANTGDGKVYKFRPEIVNKLYPGRIVVDRFGWRVHREVSTPPVDPPRPVTPQSPATGRAVTRRPSAPDRGH